MTVIGKIHLLYGSSLDLALVRPNAYAVLSPFGRILAPVQDRAAFLRFIRGLRDSGLRVSIGREG